MPQLIRPTTAVYAAFLTAVDEFRAEGRGTESDDSEIGRQMHHAGDSWSDPRAFARYVEALLAEPNEDAPRPTGYVPATTFWWAEGTEFLGRIQIRHRLTERLRNVGGHIGYDVRPSARRQGHATAMLRAALPVASELDIDEALITCDVDNAPSRKVIEANGGVLADVRNGKLRFWVPTR